MEQNTELMLTKKEKRELKRQEKKDMKNQKESKKSTKRIVMWVLVILILGLVVLGMVRIISSSSPTGNGEAVSFSIHDSDWVKGNKNASTTLIEYSDFQCPACGVYQPIVKQLAEDFGLNMRFVYRHFPLQQHQNADLAARVAEAAGKQGKFWEMHNVIFENQTKWAENGEARDIFIGYAKDLKLNLDQFNNDIDSNEVKEKVDGDYKSGLSAGVDSTPSFFLNGVKIQNPRTYDEFKSIIEQSIGKSTQ